MHKGFDSTLDSQTPIVTHGGVFDSEPVVFHPTQDPISSTDGSAHAMGTGSKGGCSSHAVRVTGHRTHALTTRAAACEEDGTGRGTPITPAIAFSDSAAAHSYGVAAVVEGTPPLRGGQGGNVIPAVAFKPSHYTRGKDGAPSEVVAPLSADADKGDQDTVIATPIDMRQASRGEKVTNNRSQGSGGPPGHGVGDAGDPAFTVSERGQAVAVRTANTGANGHGVADEVTHTIDQVQGQAIAFKPGQSEAAGGTFVTEEFTPTMQAQNNGSTAVPAVAFTKAKRAQSNEDDESWVPGEVAPTQNQFDQGDTRATTVVAFANRTRDGIKVPEVMKDGVVPALTNPGNGGRADAVNIQTAMQVRRLTPTECEFLQGFPENYTLVTYRNKPAADGPRYRALGNSMAVPCMWWLGKRIHEATQCD